MRVAFTVTVLGNWWPGGVNYLVNLLSALHELPGRPIEPVVFAGLNTEQNILKRIEPFLTRPVIQSPLWTPGTSAYRSRMMNGYLLQRDSGAEEAFHRAEIDLVFQNFAWYGCRFKMPTLAWIADFQHRHLPDMFSHARILKRDIGYHALARCATQILVSSEDARHDCEQFYPKSQGKIAVLPFAVNIGSGIWQQSAADIRAKYNLPARFFFLPNQFWKHKNHLSVIKALKLIKEGGERVTVAASGNIHDNRNPEHSQNIISLIKEFELDEDFRILGMIPHDDILLLMRASVAVINPSLFEGWSTTVEEAKSIGAPLLLSDLRVHREQAPQVCKYFDPNKPEDIADTILTAEREWGPGPHDDLEKEAVKTIIRRRIIFGQRFLSIAEKTIALRKP